MQEVKMFNQSGILLLAKHILLKVQPTIMNMMLIVAEVID